MIWRNWHSKLPNFGLVFRSGLECQTFSKLTTLPFELITVQYSDRDCAKKTLQPLEDIVTKLFKTFVIDVKD